MGGVRGPGATGPGASETGLALRLGAGGRRVERVDGSCPAVGHDRVLHERLCRADPPHPGAHGEDPDLPAGKREPLVQVLENRERHVAARKRIEQFLDATERHGDRRIALDELAHDRGVAVTRTPGYGKWRGTADRLLQEGKAILADRDVCGLHFDRNSAMRTLAEERVSGLGEAIGEDDRELAEAKREARQRRRLSDELARLRFVPDTAPVIGPEPVRPALGDDGTRTGRLLWRLRRVHDWDGRLAESERQAGIEAATRTSLERWQMLREEWNRQVDRAEKAGVHVIYTAGYETLYREMESLARDDPYLAEETRSEIDRVIHVLGAAERARSRVVQHGAELAAQLKRRREMLESGWSWDERAFADREGYDAWRRGTDEAVKAAESLLSEPKGYDIHLQGSTRLGLRSALSEAREALREDDRQMAEALVPQRKGDDPRKREERIARLLDDPEKLRELHTRQIERREARKAARRRRKGRYQVRSMRM